MTQPQLAFLLHSELEFISQLLSLSFQKPTPTWLADQRSLLTTFPSSLLQPTSFFDRLESYLPCAPPSAQLCPSHKALNGVLIREIGVQVREEYTTHLKRFTNISSIDSNSNSRPISNYNQSNTTKISSLPPSISALIHRLQAIPTLSQKIQSSCEACILSLLSGSHQILSDLRASMRGRKKRGKSHAVLLPLVEAWIEWTGRDVEIRSESGRLGREINVYRRRLQRARKAARKRGVWPDGKAVHGGGDGEDGEGTALLAAPFYAEKMGMTPRFEGRMEDVHPALRDAVVRDPRKRVFRGRYSDSDYSDISKLDDEEGGPGYESEKLAKTYRDLLESSDDDVRV